MGWCQILTLIVLVSLHARADQQKLYHVRSIATICSVLDPKIVASFKCKSKNLNRTLNVGTHELIFHPGVMLTNSEWKFQLYRKFATSYKPFLINLSQDMCAMFSDENATISKIIQLNRRRKHGNFADPCPLSGRRYEQVDSQYDDFPELIPAGEYRAEIIMSSNIDGEKRNYGRMEFRGEVTTTTAVQWKK